MTIYQDQGYESREDYLRMLAEDYSLTYDSVVAIADTLGEDEDFDGLLCALEDASENL